MFFELCHKSCHLTLSSYNKDGRYLAVYGLFLKVLCRKVGGVLALFGSWLDAARAVCDRRNRFCDALFLAEKERFFSFTYITYITFIMVIMMAVSDVSRAMDSPYHFDSEKEWTILGSGAALVLLGHIGIEQQSQPREDEIVALDSKDLLSIDRPYAGRYDQKMGLLSDRFLAASILINPLGGAFFVKPSHWKSIALMGIQTSIWTGAGIQFSKGTVRRFRPRTYPGSELGMKGRLANDQVNSFFSGHVATITSGAVFAAKVFSDFHPDSIYVWPAWVAAGVFSAIGGRARVLSGAHFPTDALVGMIWGGSVAYLVPQMHKSDARGYVLYPAALPSGVGIVFEAGL